MLIRIFSRKDRDKFEIVGTGISNIENQKEKEKCKGER